MRRGKVYYKDYLAGIITETNEGEYVFQYDNQYVKAHSNEFITFTMRIAEAIRNSNCSIFIDPFSIRRNLLHY